MPFATVEVVDEEIVVSVEGSDLLAPLVTAATAAATLAQAWAESPSAPGGVGTKSAKTHANDAEGQVTLAQTARTGAEAARDAALAALGNSLIFATKAAADAALAAVAADAYIMVLADETQAGRAWRYQKVSGSYVSRGAAVNLGPLVVPRGTLSGGAETSEPIRINPPAGSQVNGASIDDAVTTGMVVTTGQFNAGTGNSYFDTVVSIGHNMNGSITSRFNAAQPISRIGVESKFQQAVGEPFKSEFHLGSLLYPIDAAGDPNEYRLASGVIPHRQADWGTGAASMSFRANVVNFTRGVDGATIMALEVATTRLRFAANYSLLFETNNQPNARQLSANGLSSHALPFVTDQDRYGLSLPLCGVPASGSTRSASGARVFSRGWNTSTLQLDAPNANASAITLRCGTTQTASSAITVTANGTTTLTFSANAITEADIGRFITGTDVPANTRIVDISSTTTAVTSNACPATVTSVTLSARTQRTATYTLDDGGNLAFGTSTAAGIAYFDTWGGVVWRDVQNGYAQRMVLNAGATGGLQVNTRVGFNGVTPIARRTVSAAATDLASAITLVNQLRQLLIDVGLAQ